jgi:hypothetical protein
MITFDPANLEYNLAVYNTMNVGLYHIMLQSTVGNNKTGQV